MPTSTAKRKAEQDALDAMLRVLDEVGRFLKQRKAELEQVCQVRDRLYRLTVTAKAQPRVSRHETVTLVKSGTEFLRILQGSPYFSRKAAMLRQTMQALAQRRHERTPLRPLKARAEALWYSGEYPSKNNVVEALRPELKRLAEQIEPNPAKRAARVETYSGTLRKFLQKLGPPPRR
jgi:hypothetical protein